MLLPSSAIISKYQKKEIPEITGVADEQNPCTFALRVIMKK